MLLLPSANTMFCFTMRSVFLAILTTDAIFRHIIIHQDNIGCFDRRIGTHASHCDSDVRSGEYRSIIDSISNKCKTLFFFFSFSQKCFHLLLLYHPAAVLHVPHRYQVSVATVSAASLRSPVSITAFLDAYLFHVVDCLFCTVFNGIGDDNRSCKYSIACHINNGSARSCKVYKKYFSDFISFSFPSQYCLYRRSHALNSVSGDLLCVCHTVHIRALFRKLPGWNLRSDDVE